MTRRPGRRPTSHSLSPLHPQLTNSPHVTLVHAMLSPPPHCTRVGLRRHARTAQRPRLALALLLFLELGSKGLEVLLTLFHGRFIVFELLLAQDCLLPDHVRVDHCHFLRFHLASSRLLGTHTHPELLGTFELGVNVRLRNLARCPFVERFEPWRELSGCATQGSRVAKVDLKGYRTTLARYTGGWCGLIRALLLMSTSTPSENAYNQPTRLSSGRHMCCKHGERRCMQGAHRIAESG